MKTKLLILGLIVLALFLFGCANSNQSTTQTQPQVIKENVPAEVKLEVANKVSLGNLVEKCNGLGAADVVNFCGLKGKQIEFYTKEESGKKYCNIKIKDSDIVGELISEKDVESTNDFVTKYSKIESGNILVQKNLGLGDASFLTKTTSSDSYSLRFFKLKNDVVLKFNKAGCPNTDTSIQNMGEIVEQATK